MHDEVGEYIGHIVGEIRCGGFSGEGGDNHCLRFGTSRNKSSMCGRDESGACSKRWNIACNDLSR